MTAVAAIYYAVAALFFVSVLAACGLPLWATLFFRRLENQLSQIASQRWITLWIALLTFGFSACLSLFCKLPEPRVHDEFAYLLQADTFLHGRLTNPPHPMWQHFETFHVMQRPTYAAKYLPAQGAFLWMGKIFAKPIFGIWLSTALAMVALFWALKAILPPQWALVGIALTFFNPQVLVWNWNYWGGTVALGAGALMLGAFWRLRRELSVSSAFAFGAGLGVLALCRPFEGLVLAVIVICPLAWRWFRKRFLIWKVFRYFVLPTAGVTGAAMIFLLFYNFRVTGDPLKLPYALYEQTYSVTPLFLWQKNNSTPPLCRHKVMADFYSRLNESFEKQQSLGGYFSALKVKLSEFNQACWYGALPVFLMALPWVWRREQIVRLNLALFLSFGVLCLFPTYLLPHYTAPAWGFSIFLVVVSLRYLADWESNRKPVGRNFVCLFTLGMCLLSLTSFIKGRWIYERDNWEFKRAELLAQLKADGPKHLVLVKYSPKHDLNSEWVYNEADVDSAKVVWARDMGDELNKELLEYFKDYKVTVLTPDEKQWGK